MNQPEPQPRDQPKTLDLLQHDLYARYEGLQSSPCTLARQRTALRIFVGYMQDKHQITTPDAITLDHIHAFQAHMSQRRTKDGLPMKPASINSVIKGVRPFLALLYDYGLTSRPFENHLQYVKVPDLLPVSVLNHSQVRQLIRKVNTQTTTGIRDRTAIELLYSTGMRIGELETLKLQDLDLDRGVARVVGKGRKERYVPIGKTALKWLISYIRGVRPFFLQGHKTDAVFLSDKGRALHQKTLRDRIRAYGLELGLDIAITPHTLRRSCTSEMLKSNANLYHVKQLLGHKSFETLNRYARLDITDLRKTHEKCHPREKDKR